MKRKKPDTGGGPNWLDTYADMVTLLLTFFVLMFSMSSVNAEKWAVLVKSFAGNSGEQKQIVINGEQEKEEDGLVDNNASGLLSGENEATSITPENPEDVSSLDELYYYLKAYVENNNLQSQVEVQKGDSFTFITFRDSIFFDGNSADLRPQGMQILDILSRALTNIDDQIQAMKIDGHTAHVSAMDSEDTIEFDWKLSSDRAVNVLTYIYSKNVIKPEKLTATGHGEYQPLIPHDGTVETMMKNRRVEIYIAQIGEPMLSVNEIYDQINGKTTNTNSSDPATTESQN